ncbi:TetR/AcrR family transcriptional regulator [Smaragdicoccus niigatensis]
MTRADREAQILDVAEQLFVETGFRQATMDELAARVGVTKPVIYDYFGSKAGVLSALLGRARAGLLEATQTAIEGATGPEDVLRRSLIVFFEYADENAQAWKLVNQERDLQALPEVEALRQQQANFTAMMMSAYGDARDEREPYAYALVVIGACEQIGRWRLDRPDVTPEIAAQYVLDAVWTGLRSRIER